MHKKLAFVLILLSVLGLAAAQQPEFTLGFAGETVTGAWNPLRLTVRDRSDVTLELQVDQGSLRTGPRWYTYRMQVRGGPGLHVLEDDVFIPDWSSLLWTVTAGGRTLASGAVNPRDRDERPVNLVLSRRAAQHLPLLPAGSRVSELRDARLPERAAAYSGVNSLLIDGSTAPPAVAAVAAAAAAGSLVLLLDPLPAGYVELLPLAPAPVNALGAGLILRGDRQFLQEQLASRSGEQVRPDELLRTLESLNPLELPKPAGLLSLLGLFAGYALLALLLLRFGAAAGMLAVVGISLLASLVLWQQLRPAVGNLSAASSLTVSAGGLGLISREQALLDLPGGEVFLPGALRPLHLASYSRTPAGTDVQLRSWHVARFAARPELAVPRLNHAGTGVINTSEHALSEVFITGLGAQGSLAAGERLEPEPGPAYPDGPLADLFSLLPAGSVITVDGTAVELLLPAGTR